MHNFASIHLSFSKDALCKISATLFATKCNENAKFDQIGEKLQKKHFISWQSTTIYPGAVDGENKS